jgi:hypothetical protein
VGAECGNNTRDVARFQAIAGGHSVPRRTRVDEFTIGKRGSLQTLSRQGLVILPGFLQRGRGALR